MRDYWHKQTSEQPLYPDLLWSRPENKQHAGKLLIIGGNAHGFAAPAEAYNEGVRAGIGTARVLLPDSLQRTVGKMFEAGEFAPSTPSGSFSRQALAELLSMSEWADSVLLAGDFGRNSETAVLLEQFIEKYAGQLTLAQDTIDYWLQKPLPLLERPETLIAPSFSQLQKLAVSARFATPFTSTMDFLHLIDALHEFTSAYETALILVHEETVFVAVEGKVSTTKLEQTPALLSLATHAGVWWLQNPTKTFEALTTALCKE